VFWLNRGDPHIRIGPAEAPPGPINARIGAGRKKVTMKAKKAFAVIGSVAAMALTLTACGGSAGSGSGSAEGSDGLSMKLALNQTEEHPSYIALDSFGERLSEATDGRWDIEVYPNETLGAQQEALQLVSDGSVEMAIVSGTQLENLNDDFKVFNLPQVFDSIDHQMGVMSDQEIVGDLFTSLEDGQNLTVLGGFTQGARSLYNGEGPVTTPADMAGMKVRVQESDIHLEMVRLMGGAATPMAFGEVYTALQSGVLDAAENNEISYLTQKHNEVAPYFSNTRHMIGIDYLIINKDVLASMSAEDRAVFDKEWAAAVDEHTEMWKTQTEQAITDLKAAGAKFNDVDTEAFRKALAPMIDENVSTDTQKELYEATRAAAE
jgi:tripartite ATP-independent transporter DctP family solute receptor